jgi:glycosyltransferase involved in cell wall biosynthesis
MAETENNREWNINKDELNFPHEVMFKGILEDMGVLESVIETWKRLNRLNPDILIICGYSSFAYWAGFFYAKLHKRKIILWSSSNEDTRNRNFLKEKFKGFFVKGCDAANVYGLRSRDYLVKLGMQKDRILIKGNITDNAYYYNETIKLKSKKESLCEQFGIPLHNFLYIGRFSEEKNILCLLDAYRKIKVNNPGWGLILVGSGPQKDDIADYIKRYAINAVFMPGFKQKEEVPKYLAVSNVFVLPSITETWGLVVNEAMASGLPVLVSKRCGCFPDLIEEGVNGFSFDPFNIEDLYGRMKDVVEGKYDLGKMGKASIEIIKQYTPKSAARIIKETIALATMSG